MALVMSPEQRECANRATRGKHCRVSACCGAGKTRVLLGAAFEDPTQKVLILSFNKALATETASKVNGMDHIDVYNIHKFASLIYGFTVPDNRTLQHAVKRNVPMKDKYLMYDLIAVDEIQDVFQAMVLFLSVLVMQQKKEVSVLLVGDDAQTLYSFMHNGEQSLYHKYTAINSSWHWNKKTLSKTQRLTPEIVRFVNRFFREPQHEPLVSAKPEGTGPLPHVVIGYNMELLSLIRQQLTQHPPGDIMILCYTLKKSWVSIVETFLVNRNIPTYNTMYPAVDEDRAATGKVILSTYHRSKGLERPVVIVVGLSMQHWLMNDRPGGLDAPQCDATAHVAVTRAMNKLILFVHAFHGLYPTIRTLDNLTGYATVQRISTPKTFERKVQENDNWLARLQEEEDNPPKVKELMYSRFKEWVPDAEMHAFAERVVRVDTQGWWGGDADDWDVDDDNDLEEELMAIMDDQVLDIALTIYLTQFDCVPLRDVRAAVEEGQRHTMRYDGHAFWGPMIKSTSLPWRGPKTPTKALELALMYNGMHAVAVGGIGSRMQEWSERNGHQRGRVCRGFRTLCVRLMSDLKQSEVIANAQVTNDTDGVSGTIDLLSDGLPVVFTTSSNAEHLSEAALRHLWWNATLMPGARSKVYFLQNYTHNKFRVNLDD